MRRPRKGPLSTLSKSTLHVAKDTAPRVELELQLGEASIGCLSLCGELELVAGPDIKYEYKVLTLKAYSYDEIDVEI